MEIVDGDGVKVDLDSSRPSEALEFDTQIFSITAIKRAAYEFSNKCFITLSGVTEGKVKVILAFSPSHIRDKDRFIQEFTQSVLDNQVRLDVEKEYGAIRKLIVAQAFHPCANLTEIIDALEL